MERKDKRNVNTYVLLLYSSTTITYRCRIVSYLLSPLFVSLWSPMVTFPLCYTKEYGMPCDIVWHRQNGSYRCYFFTVKRGITDKSSVVTIPGATALPSLRWASMANTEKISRE